MHSIEWWHVQWPGRTPNADFKVTVFLKLNISKTTRDRAIVTIERQQEVVYPLSNGDISNDLDGPLTRFSRSRHFWGLISQKRCVLWTKLLKNTNIKPYTICRMVPLSMTLNDIWPRFQGHDRHFSTLNISETTRDTAIVTIERQ